MDLNKTTKTLCGILAVTGMFAILGVAGDIDRREQIIYTMPNEIYERICLELGHGCTDKQVEERYMANKNYYDKFK